MNHPLTDKMCGDIAENLPDYNTETCMRAAWDKAIEYMSQCIEENGHKYVACDYELGCQSDFSQMTTDFKKAMRPQQQENNG